MENRPQKTPKNFCQKFGGEIEVGLPPKQPCEVSHDTESSRNEQNQKPGGAAHKTVGKTVAGLRKVAVNLKRKKTEEDCEIEGLKKRHKKMKEEDRKVLGLKADQKETTEKTEEKIGTWYSEKREVEDREEIERNENRVVQRAQKKIDREPGGKMKNCTTWQVGGPRNFHGF